ncbi:MAG: DUF6295 family protein [Streptosporangiaceae bacterium]
MCTYATEKVEVAGSGKGPEGWFPLSAATVYFDHPVHAPADHTLNIDFLNPGRGPSARVAVELTADSARELVDAIQTALRGHPDGVLDQGAGQPSERRTTEEGGAVDALRPNRGPRGNAAGFAWGGVPGVQSARPLDSAT